MEKRVGTFSQIYIQVIFAVQNRVCLLDESWEEELYKYITGIVKSKEQSLVAINGYRDHIHILLRIRPSCRLSDLVREVKKSSTEFIKSRRFIRGWFSWHEGYGAFSYSRWDVDRISNYIKNQKEHHKKRTFQEEYLQFLKEFEVEYNDEYLFGRVDENAEV